MNRSLRLALVASVFAGTIVLGAADGGAAPAPVCVASSPLGAFVEAAAGASTVDRTDRTSWPLAQPVQAWSPNRRLTAHLGPNRTGVPRGAVRVGAPSSVASTVVFDLYANRLRPSQVAQPVFSPDGTRVAFVAMRASGTNLELWVVGTNGRGAVRVSDPGQPVMSSIAWSPDSASLYYGVSRVKDSFGWNGDQIDVFTATSNGAGTSRLVIETAYYLSPSYPLGIDFDPPARITDLAVSPDGARIAFTGYDFAGGSFASDLFVADIDGTDVRQLALGDVKDQSHRFPQWSPDSSQLAVALGGGSLAGAFQGFGVIDVASGDWVRRTAAGGGQSVAAWSSDGTSVAFGAYRADSDYHIDLSLLDVATGRTVKIARGPERPNQYVLVAWVPCLVAAPVCDGKRATILGSSRNDTIRGTRGDDVIVVFGGADTVDAGAGDDRVCGGRGADSLAGGPGTDRLFGEADADRLNGGPGADLLDGGAKRDTCVTGGGADRLRNCP